MRRREELEVPVQHCAQMLAPVIQAANMQHGPEVCVHAVAEILSRLLRAGLNTALVDETIMTELLQDVIRRALSPSDARRLS